MSSICDVCGIDMDLLGLEEHCFHLRIHKQKSASQLAHESLERMKKSILKGD